MHDIVIRGGMIYDGSGGDPYAGDVGIDGQQIAALAPPGTLDGARVIDADGLAVAPGFINMLSWAVESLIEDGRAQSDLRQGVTLEVMGEGFSMGPLSDAMKAAGTRGMLGNNDIQYDITWTTLGEYLDMLIKRGVSINIASFVGTSTLRINVMGYDDRPPTPPELARMQALARQAMREGAVGLSAALIYPPASYASTAELIALASAVAEFGGMYISHLRSEGSRFLEAVDELITISEQAQLRAEIYHLKAAGRRHWGTMAQVIERVEQARSDGLNITADMYLYPAGGTGLNAGLPDWAHEGGSDAMLARLRDPDTRARVKHEILNPTAEWESMWTQVDSPEGMLLAGFTTDALKPLTGRTLAEVAALRGTDPIDTAFDLLLEDGGRIFTLYFTMSEDNLRRQVTLPWVSFCSDAEALSPEGVFLKSNPHPRAYGNFARLLGRYVRDEGLVPLPEAIRRLTSLPARNLRVERRGSLQVGYYADVVLFDPAAIRDRATFAAPHQFAEGVQHVLVNGTPVIHDGEHTGATPGQVARGPGWGQFCAS